MTSKKQTRAELEKQKLEDRLDQELADSFPASDPPQVTRSPRISEVDDYKNQKKD